MPKLVDILNERCKYKKLYIYLYCVNKAVYVFGIDRLKIWKQFI